MNMDLDAATKEAPTLTLDPFAEAKAEIVEKKPEELVEEQAVPEMELTPEEQKQVDDFAAQIDLTNTQAVLQYGAGSQKKIADFSETALSNVRTKDMGEVGNLLTGVVAQLKDFDTEEDKGFFGLFKKSGDKLSNLKAKYDKAEVNITKICDAMESHQVVLLKDVAVLDKLYQLNLNYFKELSMYIAAGKKSVDWCFPTMPSEEWKNGVGSALTAYAADQTDANWDGVVSAFVDGWATEYQLSQG